MALAAWQPIAPALPAPACLAGYSAGELAAFSVAGVFDADAALVLAGQRAAAMDRCAEGTPGGLLAVGGLVAAAIDRLCASTGVAVAIRNGATSVVLGGPCERLDEAERMASALGARCTRLRIGIASQTPWMRAAADVFGKVLTDVRFDAPRTVLFGNACERVRNGASARQALSAQIVSTVRWDECMESIRARGVARALEIGPGQALARLWNERYPDIPARSCDEFRRVTGIENWVGRCCRC